MKKFFWFASMAAVLILSLTMAQPVSSETVVNIENINWGPYSTAGGINEMGQVVGYYFPDNGPNHAALWSKTGGITDLGPGIALGVNDIGQVVGTSGNNHAFVWTNTTGMVDIHTIVDPPITWAFDINNQGQAVGWYSYGCGSWWCFIPPGDGVFLWTQATGMRDLNEETGLSLNFAYDINENGQIVGDSENGPYVWSQADGIQYITGNSNDHAYSINDAGQVVGHMQDGRIFVWSIGNGITYLNLYNEGYVFINNLGQVTGSNYYDSRSHAFFWSPETDVIILPDLTPDLEFPASYGGRSNTSGQIVGTSVESTSYSAVSVLWTIELPPPTPQKQIAQIDAKVDTLVSTGILDQGEGTALISKLDAATAQVNKGNNKAACNILGAFINTIEAFVNSERLTSTQAQPLINATNTAINSLP